MRCAFLMSTVVILGACAISRAQPPAQGIAVNPPNQTAPGAVHWNEADERAAVAQSLSHQTPAETLWFFLNAVQHAKWDFAALCVAGGPGTHGAVAQIKKLVSPADQNNDWRLSDVLLRESDAPAVARNFDGDSYFEVSAELIATDSLAVELRQTEKIVLHRESVTWPKGLAHGAGEARVWHIVPSDAAAVAKLHLNLGPINTYALYLSDAGLALEGLGQRRSVNQAKLIALGVMQFTVDYGEKFAFDATNWQERLGPYVQAKGLFTAPGDPPATASYSFNPQLLGKSMADIAEAGQTVLFYLGKDGKLDYRYGGGATVAFADGHVEMVREGQTLRWNP